MGLPLKKYTDLLVNYLRPEWGNTLLMVVLLLVSVGLELVNPLILRYFIDTALSSRASASLTLVALLFIGIALTNQVISILATYISENVAWTATNMLRTDLITQCLSLDMEFHTEHITCGIFVRITAV